MNRFIARETELNFLQEKYESKGGQFLILYGRRRIGKTETISHFCKDKNPVFYTCTQTEDATQIKNFSQKLLSFDIPQKKYITEFSNWEQAFLAVLDIPISDGKKQILVIDEFPYMAKGNPEITSILKKLWDTEFKNSNIMIILCGSAMSYIEKEILSEKNPLYGRSTGIFKMLPMPYFDSAKFFPSWNNKDKILAHAILGGIPYYLSQFDDSKNLKQNVCSSILKRGAILYSEPEFLLRQELREPGTYNTIIQSIASGRTAFNEIQQSTLVEKGKLSVYLKHLIELGIVLREFPILSSEKERQNSQRGLYRLKDSFFTFWYKFVFPNLSSLEFGDWENIYNSIIEPQLNEYASTTFENICIEWLRVQNLCHKLPFVFTQIGRWWDKNVEIDIIAVNEDKSEIISAECKFHNSVVNDSELKTHLLKNLFSLKKKENAIIHFWYFSWSGFTEQAKEFAKKNNIYLVTGEDLFE
ncbi:MAG: ATP-binding protein [Treponema sp.]|nr:ATP-binding protein [Treponema sp.]